MNRSKETKDRIWKKEAREKMCAGNATLAPRTVDVAELHAAIAHQMAMKIDN